jgi:16S rRNA processing protein RimM
LTGPDGGLAGSGREGSGGEGSGGEGSGGAGRGGEEGSGGAGRGGGGSGAILVVGRVGRAHGLDGSFYVTRPRARMLTLGTDVSVGATSTVIVRRAGTDRHPIVRLEGVDDREGAEALRGSELSVEPRDAPVLGEGEWWAHELEGCTVADQGTLLGTVTRLLELPSCEALEVLPAEGGEPVLVPMVKDAVRSVDAAARRIDVDLGFLNLAAPRGRAQHGSPEGEGQA